MSRFREEHYATKAWKAAFTLGGKRKEDPVEADRGASRAEYLKKPSSVRKAIHKAEAARLNGF